MENWFQVLQFGQSILVGVAGIVAWVWARQQKAERDLLDLRFDEVDRRVEHINKQLSERLLPAIQELIARVDRMPDELRQKFLPLDRAMDLIEESRRDRAALWDELAKRGGRGHPR